MGSYAFGGLNTVEVSKNNILNNKLFRIFKEKGSKVIKSLIILIKSPVSGVSSILKNFSKVFTLALSILLLLVQAIVCFKAVFKLQFISGGSITYYFITAVVIFLGCVFSNIMVSGLAYIFTFYIFKNKISFIDLWAICIFSNTTLLVGISIILFLKISGIGVLIAILLICFMFSLLSMFVSIMEKSNLNEDKTALLCFSIYITFIGSAYIYYSVFIK